MKKNLVLLVLVLTACPPDTDKILYENKKPVEDKLVLFNEIKDLVKSTQQLTQDDKITLSGDPLDFKNESEEKRNAVIMELADFDDLATIIESKPVDVIFSPVIQKAVKLVREKKFLNGSPASDSTKYTEMALKNFTNIKYAIVIRNTSYQKPVEVSSTEFVPGHIGSDVLVFDVINKKYLGGFRINASNSDSVKHRDSSDVKPNLEANLVFAHNAALFKGIDSQIIGAVPTSKGSPLW